MKLFNHNNCQGLNRTEQDTVLTKEMPSNSTVRKIDDKARTGLNLLFCLSSLVLAIVLTQPVNATEFVIQPKISNGKKVTTEEWPFLVALVKKDTSKSFCTGSLISKKWVLTAAHCVIDKDNIEQTRDVNEFDVLVNHSTLSANIGERITVKNIEMHSSFPFAYLFNSLDNDIALIELSTPALAEPIEILPFYSGQDSTGSAKALGWGVTDSFSEIFGFSSDDLQQVDLPIISNKECIKEYRGFTQNMLCAGFNLGNKGGVCPGDSGGPLVIYDVARKSFRQVGITSFKLGHSLCGSLNADTNNYSFYTRAKNYKYYISEKICTTQEIPTIPNLKGAIAGQTVTLTWGQSNLGVNYQLTYTVHGEKHYHSIEMNGQTTFSITLPAGSDYDVWIEAYQGNCISDFSEGVRVAI